MISLCSYDSPARKEPQDRRARGLGGESTAAPLGPPGCSHALTGDAQAFLGCNFFSTSSLGRVPRPSVCPVTEVLELVQLRTREAGPRRTRATPQIWGGGNHNQRSTELRISPTGLFQRVPNQSGQGPPPALHPPPRRKPQTCSAAAPARDARARAPSPRAMPRTLTGGACCAHEPTVRSTSVRRLRTSIVREPPPLPG